MLCPRCGSVSIRANGGYRVCNDCGHTGLRFLFEDTRPPIVQKADKATAGLRGQRPLNHAEAAELARKLSGGTDEDR